MSNRREYFFTDVNDLVNYIFFKHGVLSPLKLQKMLYFLFAFYAGMYSGTDEKGVQEADYSEENFPIYLFPGRFEAWTYGPVMPEVYAKQKYDLGSYSQEDYAFEDKTVDNEIKKFIDELSEQTIELSDFALVDRSHEDETWKKAIAIGNSTKMAQESIADEYKQLQLTE